MPQIVRYLTHPQVLMEPLRDVRAWSLNQVGSNRVASLAAQLGSLSGTRRVVSSDETKALETATPLASALGVALEVRPRMHENDRSATGFLPPQEFEAVADQFFPGLPRACAVGKRQRTRSAALWPRSKPAWRGRKKGISCSLDTEGSAPCCSARCLASVSTGASTRAQEVAVAGSPSTPSFGNHNADGSRWKP